MLGVITEDSVVSLVPISFSQVISYTEISSHHEFAVFGPSTGFGRMSMSEKGDQITFLAPEVVLNKYRNV